MSTTPVSPTPPPPLSSMAQVPGPETHNYHKAGLPLLSFFYALYCDAEFSQANFDIWLAARLEGRDYRGYLEPYRWDQVRRFPVAAMDIIAVEVPKNTPVPVRYVPTLEQCWELMAFLVAEVTGAPEIPLAPGETPPSPAPSPPSPRLPAAHSGERPLLSCLAVIFLNQDPKFRSAPETFLANVGISESARAILTKFGNGNTQFLSPGQGLALLPDLVAESIKRPACW